jgi:hypothetical protein
VHSHESEGWEKGLLSLASLDAATFASVEAQVAIARVPRNSALALLPGFDEEVLAGLLGTILDLLSYQDELGSPIEPVMDEVVAGLPDVGEGRSQKLRDRLQAIFCLDAGSQIGAESKLSKSVSREDAEAFELVSGNSVLGYPPPAVWQYTGPLDLRRAALSRRVVPLLIDKLNGDQFYIWNEVLRLAVSRDDDPSTGLTGQAEIVSAWEGWAKAHLVSE